MITTNTLRASYERSHYSFGNPNASSTVCIIGSCRIVPLLNYFRAYNELNGNPFELLCFNPVEMWGGPGTDVGECASKLLKDYRFGKVDALICESLKTCGALNTVEGCPENVFDTLEMQPQAVCRIPNWHFMHIYDAENSLYDKAYAGMDHNNRLPLLRERGALHKEKFLTRCRLSSFPELEDWANDTWLKTRLGHTSEHLSRVLSWKFFELIAAKLGLTIAPAFAAHPSCTADPYESTKTILTPLDYEANHWEFQ